jgi:membrane-bound inhibitor of C-type lysozyme
MSIKKSVTGAAAMAALILAGPAVAAGDSAKPGWRQVAYTCETGQPLTVAFRETGSAVQVQPADKPAVKLNARPAKAGFRYADSRHELRGEGEAITWRIGNRTPVKCTSDDPAAQALAAVATR